MKRKLFKISFYISLLLLILELYRWYGWDIDRDSWTVWSFLSNKRHTGLIWNLWLAWIAVFLGWSVYKSRNRVLSKFLALVWLLWLPNTLYMVTDIKYFRNDGSTTLLHEIVFYGLFAVSGILLYVLAVHLVWLKYKFNKKWLGAITILAIIGVIAGRVLRWNSWYIFTNPEKLLSDFIKLF